MSAYVQHSFIHMWTICKRLYQTFLVHFRSSAGQSSCKLFRSHVTWMVSLQTNSVRIQCWYLTRDRPIDLWPPVPLFFTGFDFLKGCVIAIKTIHIPFLALHLAEIRCCWVYNYVTNTCWWSMMLVVGYFDIVQIMCILGDPSNQSVGGKRQRIKNANKL